MPSSAEQGTQPAAKPAKPSVQPATRARRRPAIIALGVALTLVSGVGASYLIANAGQTRSVFVATKTLERGHQITAQDLTTIEVPTSQQLEAFDSSEAKTVIGQYVGTKLNSGALVGPGVLGKNAPVDEGTSIVGVSLTSAQMPPYPLVAGDHVRIVDTPITQGDPPANTPASIKATIVTVAPGDEKDGQGATVVAVAVDKDRAADLAARAATGRVALVLDAGR